MGDTKISALPAATKIGIADIGAIVQGGTTKEAAFSLYPWLTAKIIRVDGTNGNDSGQAAGDFVPFKTVSAAFSAAVSAGGSWAILLGAQTFTENAGVTIPDNCALIGIPGITKITSNLNVATNAVLRPGNNSIVSDLIVECTSANSAPIGILTSDTAVTGAIFYRVTTIGLIDGFKIDNSGTTTIVCYDCICQSGPTTGTIDCLTIQSGANNVIEAWNCDLTSTGNGTTFASPRGVFCAAGNIRVFAGKITISGAGSSGSSLGISVSGGNVEAHNLRIKRDNNGVNKFDLSQSSGTLSIDNNIVRDDGAALATSGTITFLGHISESQIDVSATSRIIGRKTSGAGGAEECTLSQILDFIGSAARGDILFRGASVWARLAAGTSGALLQTQGSGADPQWKTLAGVASKTSDTDQTATTETAHVTFTVPANSVAAGTVFRIWAYGDMDQGTTAITFTPTIRWGGTAGTSILVGPTITGPSGSAGTLKKWKAEIYLTIRSIGASGSGHACFSFEHHIGAAYAYGADVTTNSSAITIDTTANKDLVLTWTLSAITGTPHVRTRGGGIEIVNP